MVERSSTSRLALGWESIHVEVSGLTCSLTAEIPQEKDEASVILWNDGRSGLHDRLR
jgi:hypothetical protein